jgi:hypothetical protein
VTLPHVAGIAHKCSEYDLWHARLGHPSSKKNMERLQKENSVRGIETSILHCSQGHLHCEVCVLGKQSKENYPRCPATATERLQIVHMDVGEMHVPGVDGERYMLTELDDFSKVGDARALTLKSQVGDAVKAILVYLEIRLATQ